MIYNQPVGTLRTGLAWSEGWYDANPYGTYYTNPATGLSAYHTGADLNKAGDADAHAGVFASADGTVVFAGSLAVWHNVIVIQHSDGLWTRYAHVENMRVKKGDLVTGGQQIANVGNADGTMAYHCHFDIAKIDLGKSPGDWPGTDLARLKKDYLDPKLHINEAKMATRGDPRIQYGRTYNALHSSVSLDEAKKILEIAWANGETVGKSFDDAGVGNLDVRVAKLWNIPEAEKAGFRSFYSTYYPGVAVVFLTTVVTPPSSKAALGIHCIHRHDIAQRELARGCPAVTVMDGKVSARNMAVAYPKAKIIYRRYVGTSWPSTDEMVNLLEVAADDPPNLCYVGLNEADSQPDSMNIQKRGAWDIELAKKIRAKGSKALYLAASYGHGNPPGEVSSVFKTVGDVYRDSYNSGLLGFDLHGYSCGRPPRAGQYEPPIYYEIRWQDLFYYGGFNPLIRAIYQTEAGIEGGCKAGGVGGGIPANGYTGAEFLAWCNYWYGLQNSPILVNGTSYPSPFVSGTIFQAGDSNSFMIDTNSPEWLAEYWELEMKKRGIWSGDFHTQTGWAGYNIDNEVYLSQLRPTW